MILDRVTHPVMVLVVAKALVTNIYAFFEAIVLRNHLPMPMPRLVMVAQIVDLLHVRARLQPGRLLALVPLRQRVVRRTQLLRILDLEQARFRYD